MGTATGFSCGEAPPLRRRRQEAPSSFLSCLLFSPVAQRGVLTSRPAERSPDCLQGLGTPGTWSQEACSQQGAQRLPHPEGLAQQPDLSSPAPELASHGPGESGAAEQRRRRGPRVEGRGRRLRGARGSSRSVSRGTLCGRRPLPAQRSPVANPRQGVWQQVFAKMFSASVKSGCELTSRIYSMCKLINGLTAVPVIISFA